MADELSTHSWDWILGQNGFFLAKLIRRAFEIIFAFIYWLRDIAFLYIEWMLHGDRKGPKNHNLSKLQLRLVEYEWNGNRRVIQPLVPVTSVTSQFPEFHDKPIHYVCTTSEPTMWPTMNIDKPFRHTTFLVGCRLDNGRILNWAFGAFAGKLVVQRCVSDINIHPIPTSPTSIVDAKVVDCRSEAAPDLVMEDVFLSVDEKLFEGRFHPWAWNSSKFSAALFNQFKVTGTPLITRDWLDLCISSLYWHIFAFNLFFFYNWMSVFFSLYGEHIKFLGFTWPLFSYSGPILGLIYALVRLIANYVVCLLLIAIEVGCGFVAMAAQVHGVIRIDMPFGWLFSFSFKWFVLSELWRMGTLVPVTVITDPPMDFSSVELNVLISIALVALFSYLVTCRPAEKVATVPAFLAESVNVNAESETNNDDADDVPAVN